MDFLFCGCSVATLHPSIGFTVCIVSLSHKLGISAMQRLTMPERSQTKKTHTHTLLASPKFLCRVMAVSNGSNHPAPLTLHQIGSTYLTCTYVLDPITSVQNVEVRVRLGLYCLGCLAIGLTGMAKPTCQPIKEVTLYHSLLYMPWHSVASLCQGS